MAHPDSGTGDTGHSRSIRTRVRDDLAVPVLALNTQTEALFYASQRQDETDKFRSWEVAGASHMPKRTTVLARAKTDRDGITNTLNTWSAVRISEVDWFYVLDAAVLHVHRWITEGKLPPRMPPIQIDGRDYAFDQYGNALGGIRLPEEEVPVARYVAGPTYPLGGFTIPFTPAKLKELYPTHDDYVAKITEAANAAVQAGVILPGRAEEYVKAAKAAPIPEEIITEVRTENRASPEGRTTR
jgi:hypothetical protein